MEITAILGSCLSDTMGYMLQSRMEDGLQKNLGLDPDEALHIAQLVGEDGKYHYREDMNFYGSIIFSPDLTDEEFERAMDILDFCSTEEGQEIINMGFEGEDWELDENGDYVSLLPDEITGNASSVLGSKYPSADVFLAASSWATTSSLSLPTMTRKPERLFPTSMNCGTSSATKPPCFPGTMIWSFTAPVPRPRPIWICLRSTLS